MAQAYSGPSEDQAFCTSQQGSSGAKMPPKRMKKTKPVLINRDGSPATIIKYDRAQKYWRCRLCAGCPTITDEWSTHLSSKMHIQRVMYTIDGSMPSDDEGHQYEKAYLAPGLKRMPGVPHEQAPPGLVLEQDIYETPDSNEELPREEMLAMMDAAADGERMAPAQVHQPAPHAIGQPMTEDTGFELLEAIRTMNTNIERLQETLSTWEDSARGWTHEGRSSA